MDVCHLYLLQGLCINPIILCVRANKTILQVHWSIEYQYHQAVIVATNVERHPVVS